MNSSHFVSAHVHRPDLLFREIFAVRNCIYLNLRKEIYVSRCSDFCDWLCLPALDTSNSWLRCRTQRLNSSNGRVRCGTQKVAPVFEPGLKDISVADIWMRWHCCILQRTLRMWPWRFLLSAFYGSEAKLMSVAVRIAKYFVRRWFSPIGNGDVWFSKYS